MKNKTIAIKIGDALVSTFYRLEENSFAIIGKVVDVIPAYEIPNKAQIKKYFTYNLRFINPVPVDRYVVYKKENRSYSVIPHNERVWIFEVIGKRGIKSNKLKMPEPVEWDW